MSNVIILSQGRPVALFLQAEELMRAEAPSSLPWNLPPRSWDQEEAAWGHPHSGQHGERPGMPGMPEMMPEMMPGMSEMPRTSTPPPDYTEATGAENHEAATEAGHHQPPEIERDQEDHPDNHPDAREVVDAEAQAVDHEQGGAQPPSHARDLVATEDDPVPERDAEAGGSRRRRRPRGPGGRVSHHHL